MPMPIINTPTIGEKAGAPLRFISYTLPAKFFGLSNQLGFVVITIYFYDLEQIEYKLNKAEQFFVEIDKP